VSQRSDVFQPAIRLENPSRTAASQKTPSPQGMRVASATHNRFGALAVKFRLTRSGAGVAFGFCRVEPPRQPGAGTRPATRGRSSAARPAYGPPESRHDSAFYQGKFIAACLRGGVRFSVTVRINPKVARTITTIPDDAWVEITYPNPIWEEDQQRFVSRAQIAETTYTAFEDTPHEVTARLIVRRIPDLNKTATGDQGELFTVWRYHAAFTNSPFVLVQAEAQHRGHAVIEQVFAELIDGPLAHLPSGIFDANNAWLTCIAIAHNLTRGAATLAGPRYATARPATIRRHLINIAARISRHARSITIHLPTHWPWQHPWQQLFTTTHPPPAA
jgi:hypothetical protein